MMKKLLIAASILLMASSVSFAQDSNERYYNYEILTPQRNNSRTAPKPKVEGWAAERVIAHHEASSHRRLRPKGQIHPESAQSKKY